MVARILAGAAGAYLLVVGGMYTLQRSLVFAPDTRRLQPAEVGLDSVHEVSLPYDDGWLYSWYGEARKGRPTFLFFHGNGGSVASRAEVFRQLMSDGSGVFMLGYPGYGGSYGSPSEEAFVGASTLAYEHLRRLDIEAHQIVIYGQSLGSSVATQLAAAKDAAALVLLAPLLSAVDVADELYPYLPVELLLKDPFPTRDHIGSVEEPVLIVHGDQDRIIPPSNGKALFVLANEPKSLHLVEGGGHNDLYGFPVVPVIQQFLDASLPD